MATIKAYTDLEQSKKLAEILPIESADYCWGIDEKTLCFNNSPYPCPWKDYTVKQYYVPCWSLAALLSVLHYPQLSKDKLGSGKEGWMVSAYPYDCRYDSCWHDNPIDACYEMILKLHELKML